LFFSEQISHKVPQRIVPLYFDSVASFVPISTLQILSHESLDQVCAEHISSTPWERLDVDSIVSSHLNNVIAIYARGMLELRMHELGHDEKCSVNANNFMSQFGWHPQSSIFARKFQDSTNNRRCRAGNFLT
jgi:hypothetical protein